LDQLQDMTVEIVLFQPLIPQNTGSIARLTASNQLKLNLIEPLGFELSDKYLKRAGLDYWKFVNLEVFPDWKSFLTKSNKTPDQISIFTTKAHKNIYQKKFSTGDVLVFGSESHGLPEEFREQYGNSSYRIPMIEEGVRSLNLANSVGIVTFEALRQLRYSSEI